MTKKNLKTIQIMPVQHDMWAKYTGVDVLDRIVALALIEHPCGLRTVEGLVLEEYGFDVASVASNFAGYTYNNGPLPV